MEDLLSTRSGDTRRNRYRFADGILDLSSGSLPFAARLAQIYGECATSAVDVSPLTLRSEVRHSLREPVVAAMFQDNEPLDSLAFILSLFPDGRYREVSGQCPGWRYLAEGAESCPFAALRDDFILLDSTRSWEAFIGTYCLHRVLRLQREILFFHAASVSVNGSGVLLGGPEKAGKTTLSMSLASRGNAFMGDDLAAVRRGSHELIPIRRSVSVRPGPRARIVSERLTAGAYEEEPYPDGETRIRAFASDLFPSARPLPVPLKAIFFLRGFGDRSQVEPIATGMSQLRWLTPLASTLWGVSRAARIKDFLHLMAQVRCFFLSSGGSPEETAELVEKTVREET